MSLPLCTPDYIECVRNIETKYEECLPQCSGLWVNSVLKNEEIDIDINKAKLSQQYWNYKGFYKFPNYDGKVSEIKLL